MVLQTLGTHEQGWELESWKTINRAKIDQCKYSHTCFPYFCPFLKESYYCSIFCAFVIVLSEMGRETERNEPKKESV